MNLRAMSAACRTDGDDNAVTCLYSDCMLYQCRTDENDNAVHSDGMLHYHVFSVTPTKFLHSSK